MLVSDFDYELPENLIAQEPLTHRVHSKMMVVDRKTQHISHSHFRCFTEHLNPGDLLVLNTSRVIPARLWGKIGKKDIEFLLLKENLAGQWESLCRPSKKVKKDDVIVFSPSLTGKVAGVGDEGLRTIRFSKKDILKEIEQIGYAPLPPYIKRMRRDQSLRHLDLERYQTVYAQQGMSIAAPTAGFHFTPQVLAEIGKKDVQIAEIKLDVGLATFQPVRTVNLKEHTMLEETFNISPYAADLINRAKTGRRKVVAVGTTSVRALESAMQGDRIQAGPGSTSLFISPGFKFRVVDRMLTNFHLPKSTLLMLVSAFTGHDLIMPSYTQAVQQEYRFYSYGDCMFIK